ncbi:MAG: hypothetical protein RRY20_05425 [Bilophila sp.]
MKRWVLLAVVLFFTVGDGRAAAFPDVAPSSVYVGNVTHADDGYTFVLRLQRGQGFVLQERVHKDGKTEVQTHTGKWHQIRDNALLELSNISGFVCALNVGGTGNLYVGWPLPNADYLALTLRQEPAGTSEGVSYPVAGILRFETAQGATADAVLEDRESALVHRISGKDVDNLRKQYGNRPVFIEGEVSESDELARNVGESPALHLENLLQVTEELPKAVQSTPNLFRDRVAGQTWATKDGTRRFTFVPGKDTRTGQVTFFDGTQSVALPYTLSEDGLVFDPAGCNTLRAAGHEQTAAKLKQVRGWQVEGHVLELRTKTHVVDILEKRTF